MKPLEAEITCPNCGRQVRVRIANTVPGRTMNCQCGLAIHFEGDDGRRAQAAVDHLEQHLRRLNRQLRRR